MINASHWNYRLKVASKFFCEDNSAALMKIVIVLSSLDAKLEPVLASRAGIDPYMAVSLTHMCSVPQTPPHYPILQAASTSDLQDSIRVPQNGFSPANRACKHSQSCFKYAVERRITASTTCSLKLSSAVVLFRNVTSHGKR
jgi:hypothetical protein